jgi:hypothetical protein
MPYIYTLICYGFWAYFMHGTVRLPLFMVVGALGAIAALAAVTVINHWWKISAHLTGIGGLLGDAVDTLLVLGYKRSEAMAALNSINAEGMGLEDIIKAALKKLARN